MDITKILKQVSIFKGLENADLEEIIPLTRPLHFPADSVIIKEGSEGSSMYILVSGLVKVTKTEDVGTEVFISTLQSGSFFGELSLLDNMPRSANVVAIDDCEMLHLRKRDFDQLLENNLKISNSFHKNCLAELFLRFRQNLQNFTFSQHILKETSETLDEINKDLVLAKEVQNYLINTDLLSQPANRINGIKYSFHYQPCIEVGGDFLNVAPVGDNAAMMIADVVGHGITAAMATGVLKSAFSVFSERYAQEPAKLMESVNKHYYKIMSKFYATCYCCYFDTGAMTASFVKGGHPHPFFWKDTAGDFIEIESKGIGIGIMDIAEYTEAVYPIEKGDKILFFTDGILEQRNAASEMFSSERLQSVFRDAILEDVPNKLDYILAQFNEYKGDTNIEDDITLLLVEI